MKKLKLAIVYNFTQTKLNSSHSEDISHFARRIPGFMRYFAYPQYDKLLA